MRYSNFQVWTGAIILILKCKVGASVVLNVPHCTSELVRGKWKFMVEEYGHGTKLHCEAFDEYSPHFVLSLMKPNIAKDDYDSHGKWTVVYNQGLELHVNDTRYYAPFFFDESKFSCLSTMSGWSYNSFLEEWRCFKAERIDEMQNQSDYVKLFKPAINAEEGTFSRNYIIQDSSYLASIREQQDYWIAVNYPVMKELSLENMVHAAGGRPSYVNRVIPKPITTGEKIEASFLPEQFDWRNANGFDFVSKVRNQKLCSSGYLFAVTSMIESRLQMAGDLQNISFSVQDVLDCNTHAKGCFGGLPYLTTALYMDNEGLITETCNPYKGKEMSCREINCTRTYTSGHSFVGGYFGGCNEALMRIALHKNGPLVVTFEADLDFFHYGRGIYKYVEMNINNELSGANNPLKNVHHSALLVGWGSEFDIPYWIVKNSWGKQWGENGYFRIIRGENAGGIESMALEAFPLLK